MLKPATAGRRFVTYARQNVFQTDVRCGISGKSCGIVHVCDASREDFDTVLTCLTKLRA